MNKLKGFLLILAILLAVSPVLALAEEEVLPPDPTETTGPAMASTPEETDPGQPTSDIPAQPAAEPDPSDPTNTDAEPAVIPAEDNPEEPSEPPAPEPASEVPKVPAWDEEISLGKTYRAIADSSSWQTVLRLTAARACSVNLVSDGLPVKVVVLNTDTGARQELRPTRTNDGWQPLEAALRLQKGEYLLCLTKQNAGDKGTVQLTVSEARTPAAEPAPVQTEEAEAVHSGDTALPDNETTEAAAPDRTAEAAEPAASAEMPDSEESDDEATAEADVIPADMTSESPETAEADVLPAEPGTEETPAEETAEAIEIEMTAEAFDTDEPRETGESAEAPELEVTPIGSDSSESPSAEEEPEEEFPAMEDPGDPWDPGDMNVPGPDQAAGDDGTSSETDSAVPTVTVVAASSGEHGAAVGDEITLTAEILGCDPSQVTIEWQYSPDGGLTVVTVEDANDFEYRYTVDRTNMYYVWRAVVTLTTPPPEE